MKQYPENFNLYPLYDDCKLGRKYQMYYNVLEYHGRVFRSFGPKEFAWDSELVLEYINRNEPDASWTSDYLICRKTSDGAYNAIERFDIKDPVVDDALWNVAYDWMVKEFYPYMSNSVVYTYDEIREYMIDDTSPGYPHTNKYPTKAKYLASEDGYYCDEYWRRMATDDPIIPLDAISIKVEMLPKKKIDENTPRTIIAVSADCQVAGQRLFLDQNIKMNHSAGDTSSCVGLDVFGGGWNRLGRKMLSQPNGAVVDGKRFDSRFHNRANRNIREFRKLCLCVKDRTPENLKRIDNYYNHMQKGFLVQVDGRVFYRDTGESSGHPCTVNDNTLKCRQDVTVTWLVLTPPNFHSYDVFQQHVVLCIVGDDLGMAISDIVEHYFNVAAIISISDKVNMTYTTDHLDPLPFTQLSFLSAKFVYRTFGAVRVYVPVFDCVKTRCSMLHGNKKPGVYCLIQRLCNMRVVSFGCESCTTWLESLADYIKTKYAKDHISKTPAWANSWSGWLSYDQLVRLYTGFESSPARDFKSDFLSLSSQNFLFASSSVPHLL